MKKIPVKIVELTSPSGKKAVDIMIDVFDYHEIENAQEKIRQFKKNYFELVKRHKKSYHKRKRCTRIKIVKDVQKTLEQEKRHRFIGKSEIYLENLMTMWKIHLKLLIIIMP